MTNQNTKILTILTALTLLLLANIGFSKELNNDYWQQEVNYTISVSLDDETHELKGDISIEYHNNAPNALSFIYFHLWPNAYKDQSTAFAEQQLGNRSTKFYYSIAAERGFIDQLNFSVDGKVLEWEYDPDNVDIAKVHLNEPLQSGEKIMIETPFKVKIPKSFSRLGHVGQSYQLTQWYPKPAVYDHEGWHPMPYLDQGEFYSEYGSFDVSITLPQNYVVGATGDLQNEEEIKWLNEKAAATAKMTSFPYDNDFPESAIETKTLHYIQKNVHDFAWFADKRFHVLKDQVQLPNSDRVVDTWAMFTNDEADLWLNATEYINDGVYFYSDKVGNYPYNHCTAVQSALSAGAGMEYPNITVIGLSGDARSLERVIVHEVGHNWFYGQLGSNERDHAWLDEGINSYYEERYFQEKYPEGDRFNITGMDWLDKKLNLSSPDLSYIGYLMNASQNKDQAIETHSADFTNINYFISAYGKPALALEYLAQYLGVKEFDRTMQSYYQKYEFKHPQPDDIRLHFEEETGKYLDWFFDELIGTNKKMDYRISKLQQKGQVIGNKTFDLVTLKNKAGNVRGPYTLTALKEGQAVKTIWYDGFSGEMEVLFPHSDYDQLSIDIGDYAIETRKNNNNYKVGKGGKGNKTSLQPIAGLENKDQRKLYFLPAIGYNHYDKLMLGMAFYNSVIPRKNLEFTLLPMYAFGTKRLNGTGNVDYNIYPESGWFHRVKVGVNASSFHEGFYTTRYDSIGSQVISEEPFRWTKISPSLQFNFKKKSARSDVSRTLTLRHVHILKQQFADNTDTTLLTYTSPTGILRDNYYLNEIKYAFKSRRVINPYGWQVSLEQSNRFMRASFKVDHDFNYRKSRKRFYIGAFMGAFIYENLGPFEKERFKFRLPGANGQTDAFYDNIFLGRNEPKGIWSQQVVPDQGAFRVPINGRGGNAIGTTKNFLFSINIDADIPIKRLPFSFYSNIGFYEPDVFVLENPDGTTEERYLQGITGKWIYEGGIAFKPIPGNLEIYFPLFFAEDLQNSLDLSSPKYIQRISFFINFNGVNPLNIIRNASF